jgi:hemerythrin superfamily protein
MKLESPRPADATRSLSLTGTAIAFSLGANVRAQGDHMATAKKAAKTVASKTPATARAAMSDATLLLTRDHAEVKKLFKQYEKLADAEADGEERQALAEQICAMLTVHATVEEEIFYPAAREAEVDSDLLDEAEVEHASAKDLIAQIQGMGADDELYDAKVTVLGEYIDHHVQEEEGEMFPKCRKAGMDLAALAEQLAERKAELMEEGEGQPA